MFVCNSASILIHDSCIIFISKNIVVVEILEMNAYDVTCTLEVRGLFSLELIQLSYRISGYN